MHSVAKPNFGLETIKGIGEVVAKLRGKIAVVMQKIAAKEIVT